ncbi:gamma-glutamyl-gamma-aminobutyrate hydrolase family protein [soil metagenome]
MKIAVSRASGTAKYAMYEQWLKAADASVEVVDLYTAASPEEAVKRMEECSGLVLTGGPDVEASRYGMPERAALSEAPDLHRDAIEFAVIDEARERRMPTLGICRGLQILNVAYGGTLFADMPTERPSHTEHRALDGNDSVHGLEVEPGSILKRMCRTLDGTTNSAHHQCIDKLAGLFTSAATAEDGTIEAFEWGDASIGGKPFLLAVQWHPERLDYSNPFSLPIAEHFVNEVAAFDALMKNYGNRQT